MMNKILFSLLFIFLIKKAGAQVSLDTQLRNFPIANYLNKPIDTLIAHLPNGFDTAFIVSSAGSLNRGASLQINYPNNEFWIDIYITNAHFITVWKDRTTGPPEVLWPLSLLRKEKIGSITIYNMLCEIINEGDIY
ncbi:MAG: hypothetical protein IPL97_01120 [Niastella sp.]|nr:hypothetical protein [Niastella sp.]